jgi:trehalose 6-phosphate phosphatase
VRLDSSRSRAQPQQVYESQLNPDNSAALAERVSDLLRQPRSGLVTDVDGTIAPIVERPEQAAVLPLARTALEQLRDLVPLVAVVSGRRAEDARQMVGVDGLIYVGNHGLEVWTGDHAEVVPEARPWVPRLASALAAVQAKVQRPGIIAENKGVTGSLHYRTADDQDAARTELLEALASAVPTSGLRVEEGRRVLNLLPPLTVTKGSAVRWLAREYRLQAIVYLGDDLTDAHAFSELARLRDRGEASTLSIGVVGPDTPPRVRQLADATVPSVDCVARLLCSAATRLTEGAGARGTMSEGVPTERRQQHGP